MGWDSYNRPVSNVSGETIPPFAVMELAGWTTVDGLAIFMARKPTGDGKAFLINGPTPLPVRSSQHTGMGMGTVGHGAPALFDEELTPAPGQELGPVADQWHLGEGSGFIVMGDMQGSAASPPGFFPPLPSSKRVRVIQQPSEPARNVIVGTIHTGATPAQATFIIRNVIVIEGADPTGGSPTVGVVIQNVPAELREVGTQIRAEQSSSNGLWFPVASSDLVVSTLKRFEITADKRYMDSQVLAKPVTPAGTMDAGTAEVYLLDVPAIGETQGRWYGLKAHADVSGPGMHAGYRYDAVEVTPNHAETGKPGYRILAGEGPADMLIVTIVSPVSAGSATCNIDRNVRTGCGPSADRLPKIESAGFDVRIHDTLDLAGEAIAGDKWITEWDRKNEEYIFSRPVAVQETGPVHGLLIAILPAAIVPGAGNWDVTPGNQPNAIVLQEWNVGRTKLVAQLNAGVAVTKRGLWRGATSLRGSSTEPLPVIGRLIQFNGEECFWVDSEFDTRGGVGYIKANDQAYWHAPGATGAWEDSENCS